MNAFGLNNLATKNSRIIFPQDKNISEQWFEVKEMPAKIDQKDIGKYVDQVGLGETVMNIIQLINSEIR